MFNVGSSTLSRADLDYLKNNFRIKDSTVSTLEEADLILMGEWHDGSKEYLKYKMNQVWLINKLANDGDTVFLENGLNKISPEIGLANFYFNPIKARLNYKGWDSAIERQELNKFISQLMDSACVLGDMKNSYDASEADLKQDLEILANLFAGMEKVVRLKMENANKSGLSFKNSEGKKINEILAQTKILKVSFELAQTASVEKLRLLHFVIKSQICSTLHAIYLLNNAMSFLNRNKCLSHHLINSIEKSHKIWCTAGKRHLYRNKGKEHSLGEREGLDYLENCLSGKKYIILSHKKDESRIPRMMKAVCSKVALVGVVSNLAYHMFHVDPFKTMLASVVAIVGSHVFPKCKKELNKIQIIRKAQNESVKQETEELGADDYLKAIEMHRKVEKKLISEGEILKKI